MRMRNLLSLVLATILGVGVVGTGGSARAATTDEKTPAPEIATTKPSVAARPAAPARSSDAARYAAREQKAGDLQNFRGGGASIYIGGSALTIALVIVLLIIIL